MLNVTENRLANGRCSFQIAQIPRQQKKHCSTSTGNLTSFLIATRSLSTKPTYIRSAHQLCFLGVSCFRFPSTGTPAVRLTLPPSHLLPQAYPNPARLSSHPTRHCTSCTVHSSYNLAVHAQFCTKSSCVKCSRLEFKISEQYGRLPLNRASGIARAWAVRRERIGADSLAMLDILI